MKLWIARDADGNLALYKYKPKRDWFEQMFLPRAFDPLLTTIPTEEVFKQVTWENSPQRVELNLIKK